MYKLSLLLLICLLLNSCKKVDDGIPDSDYRFDVYCSSCTITIENGGSSYSYYVQDHLTIPFNHYTPVIKIYLSTDYDSDDTLVRFTGSGYDEVLFNGTLYYGDPEVVRDFNL